MNDENQPSEPIDLDAKRMLAALAQAHRDVKAGDLAPSMVPARLREVAPRRTGADAHTIAIADAAKSFWDGFLRRARGKDQPVPLPFVAWTDVHEGGLLPGLHMLIGRTKSRKSTIATMTALRAAEAGHPVAIVPIELRRDEMFARLIGPMAGVPWSQIMTSRGAQGLSREQFERLGAASERLAALPILIDDPPKWLAKGLGDLAPRLVKQGTEGDVKRTPLVVVDYLQRVKSERERDELRLRIASATAEMSRVAKEHEIAVLLVSSTSREKGPLLAGHEKRIAESGIVLALDSKTRVIDGDPEELIGTSKESGDVEYDATSLQVLMRVPGQPDLAAMVLPAMRYTDPTWIPLRMSGAFVREGDDDDAQTIAAAFGAVREASKRDRKGKKQAESYNDNEIVDPFAKVRRE